MRVEQTLRNRQNQMNLLYFICSIIYFFVCVQDPLMFNQSLEDILGNSAFRRPEVQNYHSSQYEEMQKSYLNELMQVMNAQNNLIISLLQKQDQLQQELNKRNSGTLTASSNGNTTGESRKVSGFREINPQEISSSGSPVERDPFISKNNVKIIHKDNNLITEKKQLQNKHNEDESQSFDQDGQSNSDLKGIKANSKKKPTQTKNMVKNFAKAIFFYIRKNRDKRIRVLRYLGISDQDFMEVYEELKGHILSITQLRNLWVPDGNPFHKAFRILSCDYLRKQCLQRTFNSRVENYQVHLKYRQRLLQSLKCPSQFTILKTS